MSPNAASSPSVTRFISASSVICVRNARERKRFRTRLMGSEAHGLRGAGLRDALGDHFGERAADFRDQRARIARHGSEAGACDHFKVGLEFVQRAARLDEVVTAIPRRRTAFAFSDVGRNGKRRSYEL